MVPRMRFSCFCMIIMTERVLNTHRRRAMKKLAISTTQGVCAALLVACCAADAVSAQTTMPTRASTPHSRATLARELRDSLSAVLRAGVADRAFPGAYA